MNPKKTSRKSPARLGAYLAAGLGASAIATPDAEAAIVGIDISPSGFNIAGINGGLADGTRQYIFGFPSPGEMDLTIFNNYTGFTGLRGEWMGFATQNTDATPQNFALNDTIDNTASFTNSIFDSVFKANATESPDFGPGSYMGFKTFSGNFGWLEVTWSGATDQFQILSGAYESVAGVGILAGDTGGAAAVPEPSTWAMSALLAGGVGFTVWRRRRAAAQAKAQADLQAA